MSSNESYLTNTPDVVVAVADVAQSDTECETFITEYNPILIDAYLHGKMSKQELLNLLYEIIQLKNQNKLTTEQKKTEEKLNVPVIRKKIFEELIKKCNRSFGSIQNKDFKQYFDLKKSPKRPNKFNTLINDFFDNEDAINKTTNFIKSKSKEYIDDIITSTTQLIENKDDSNFLQLCELFKKKYSDILNKIIEELGIEGITVENIFEDKKNFLNKKDFYAIIFLIINSTIKKLPKAELVQGQELLQGPEEVLNNNDIVLKFLNINDTTLDIAKMIDIQSKKLATLDARQNIAVQRFTKFRNPSDKVCFLFHAVGTGKTVTSTVIALSHLSNENLEKITVNTGDIAIAETVVTPSDDIRVDDVVKYTAEGIPLAAHDTKEFVILIIAPSGLFRSSFIGDFEGLLGIYTYNIIENNIPGDAIIETCDAYMKYDDNYQYKIKFVSYNYNSLCSEAGITGLTNMFPNIDVVICDEAHRLLTNSLKNPTVYAGSTITPNILRDEQFINFLAPTKQTILLTGTPFQNSEDDIIDIIIFLNDPRLNNSNYSKFLDDRKLYGAFEVIFKPFFNSSSWNKSNYSVALKRGFHSLLEYTELINNFFTTQAFSKAILDSTINISMTLVAGVENFLGFLQPVGNRFVHEFIQFADEDYHISESMGRGMSAVKESISESMGGPMDAINNGLSGITVSGPMDAINNGLSGITVSGITDSLQQANPSRGGRVDLIGDTTIANSTNFYKPKIDNYTNNTELVTNKKEQQSLLVKNIEPIKKNTMKKLKKTKLISTKRKLKTYPTTQSLEKTLFAFVENITTLNELFEVIMTDKIHNIIIQKFKYGSNIIENNIYNITFIKILNSAIFEYSKINNDDILKKKLFIDFDKISQKFKPNFNGIQKGGVPTPSETAIVDAVGIFWKKCKDMFNGIYLSLRYLASKVSELFENGVSFKEIGRVIGLTVTYILNYLKTYWFNIVQSIAIKAAVATVTTHATVVYVCSMLLGWNPVFIFLLLKSIGLIISGLKGWFYTNYYINYDNVKKHLSCYSSIYNYDFNKNAIDKTKFYDEDVKNLINFPVNADGNKRAYPERYISQFLIIFNDSQTKELHDLSTKPVYEIENIIIDMEKMFFLTCNIGCDVNTPIDDDFKQRIIDNYNVYSTNTLVNYKNEYKNFKNYQLNDENEATININISGNFNEYLTTILKIKIEKNSEIFINQIFSAFNVIYKNYLKRQQQKPDDMSITFLSELQSENTKISNTLIKQCYDIMISIIKSSQQAIIGDNIDSLKPQFDEIYNNQNNIDYRTQQIDTLLGYYLYQDNEEKFKDAYKYYEGQPHPDNDKSTELLELPESLLDTRDDGTKLDTLIKRQVNFQKAILDSYNNYLTGYAEKMKKMITTVTTMYNTAEFTSVYHEDYQLEGSYNRFKSILYFLELTRCGLTTNNFDIVLQSHYRLIDDVYHYYLPLVYPSTQEIMYGFCNFLNKNNKKFIWLCDKFNSEDLQKNFEYGSKLTFPISNIHTDNPICIIISPSHVEGFSFVYNPSLFIPALCKTSGDQEQVHGRILRKYGKESKKYSYDKSIYQYFGGNKDEQTYLNQICKIYQINQKHKFFNMNQKYKLPNKLDESKSSMGLDNKNLFMYVTQLIIKTVQSANSFIWSLPPEGLINKWYNEIVFSPPGNEEELLKLEMRRQPIVSDPQKAAEWVASWYYQYPSEETQLEKLYKTISIGQTLFELMVKEENDSFDKRLKTINPQDLIIAVKEYDSDSALNMDYCQLKNNSILCNSNLTQISIERDTDTEIKYVYTKKGLYKKIKNILDREIQTKFMSEKQTGKQESEEDIETKRKKYTDEILEEKKATGRDIEEELINAKKTQFKVIMDEFFGPEIAENKIQKINTKYNKIIHDNDGILSDEEKIEIYLGFLQDIFDQIQKNEEKIEENIEGSTFLQTFIDDQIKIIEEYRKKSLAAQERALKQKFGGTRKNKNKNKKIKKTRRKR